MRSMAVHSSGANKAHKDRVEKFDTAHNARRPSSPHLPSYAAPRPDHWTFKVRRDPVSARFQLKPNCLHLSGSGNGQCVKVRGRRSLRLSGCMPRRSPTAFASACATMLAKRAGALLRDREVGSSGRGAGRRKMPRGWLIKDGRAPRIMWLDCGGT
jgi:hypothetical protein